MTLRLSARAERNRALVPFAISVVGRGGLASTEPKLAANLRFTVKPTVVSPAWPGFKARDKVAVPVETAIRPLTHLAHGEGSQARAGRTAGCKPADRHPQAGQGQQRIGLLLLQVPATESFPPGHNVPWLPYLAYITREGRAGSFLQRARLPAISESGPFSLINHEGRAHRVVRTKLPPGTLTGEGLKLNTMDIFIRSGCGACHEGEVERCLACKAPMASEHPVTRTLRIDDVEAAPANRITAKDERVRQGFGIWTVVSRLRKDGRPQVKDAEFRCGNA